MDNKLKNFKKMILKTMNLTEEQHEMFNKIPDAIHQSIFENNFNSNYQLARNIILNNFDQDSYKKIEKEKSKIHDLSKAVHHISKNVLSGGNVLFLTDTDNDGSLAQANILEFEKALTPELKSRFNTLYCQQVNGNTTRGFSVDLLDLWISRNPNILEQSLTIVTADNGINSREEQEKINKKYPNVTLIVTDHHNPDEDNVVIPNNKTMVVNPRFKPSKYFQEKNISGANVLGVLLEKTLESIESNDEVVLNNTEQVILRMREISRIANLLDYVDTDISDKPLKNHLIEKYSTLGALMNVNNSLNKIITTTLSGDEIKDIFKDVEGLELDEVVATIKKIREQNKLAEKLLNLQYRFNSLPDDVKRSISGDRIYNDLLLELDKSKLDNISDINPNYIEQLRPHIYNYAASEELLDYESSIMESMKDVYNNLKSEERKLQRYFGKTELMNIEKNENSTIMYPKEDKYLKLLNRKLLGKIYNEENNGFLMILDNVEKSKATGSFRSIYRIQNILENKEKIEDMFDIKLSFQGHDKAAGFFIESRGDKELTKEIISDVNKFINSNLTVLKEKDKRSYSHLIQTDFHFPAIDLFDKYNKAVKGSLTNMQSISPVVQFNSSTYITESKSQKDYNLQQLIKDKKYGYVPIEISFDGKTIIIPTEMLRQLAKSNYKDGVQISFMTDGAFIGNKVVPDVNKQKLIKIKSPTTESEKIIDFFEKNYKNNNYFTELPIEYIKESPFFKYNKFGDKEFARYEATVINVLERSGTDKLVVLDTEANGLGNAPKVINFGVVELMIDPKSGSKLRTKLFDDAAFKSIDGRKFLLSKSQISELTQISEDEYLNLPFEGKQNIIVNMKSEAFNKKYYIAKNTSDYKELNNFIKKGEFVYVNRSLKSDIGSLFINDNDAKVSERIKTLTSIDNTLLNKIGITSKAADEILLNRYKGQKCIFQAHNLPYDLGVIKGNFKDFYNLATDFENGNLLNDSALYSRKDKLAYDPISIAAFEKDTVPALDGIQFFHSESSELNLKKFLSSEENGTMPDRTGRYVLKKKDGKLSIIDTKENSEISVDVISSYDDSYNPVVSKEDRMKALLENIKIIEMPKNAIKYSVQALSDYDIIRAMILSSSDFKLETIPAPKSFENSKGHLDYFMMNYHFDSSFLENLQKFQGTLSDDDKKRMFVTEGFIEEEIERLREAFHQEQAALPPRQRKRKEPDFAKDVGPDPKLKEFYKFGEDFLKANEKLQSKFHEVWAYKKVLNVINPNKENIKDSDLIELVSYQTSLSEDKVVRIMEDAIEYKKAYNLDNVIQKEPHNNVFFDKCDVVMESVLTYKRPTDRSYNSYTHSVNNIVDMFMENIFDTTCKHKISQTRSMALDSFSRKQAKSYKRSGKTDYIVDSQKIDIENVKFKFSAETLPQDTFAYGVLKKEITEEQVEEFSELLEFVVRNEQMAYSIDAKIYETEEQQEEMKSMLKVLKSNEDMVQQIKEKASEFFEYVYYSRKENEMKKCMQLAQEAIINGTLVEPPKKMEALRKREKNVVVKMVKEFIDIANNLEITKMPVMSDVDYSISRGEALDAFLDSQSKNEEAISQHPIMNFLSSISEISEEDFQETLKMGVDENIPEDIAIKNAIIKKVSIKRQNDAKHLFKFNELLNNYLSNISEGVEMNYDYSNELNSNRNKLASKAKPKKASPQK